MIVQVLGAYNSDTWSVLLISSFVLAYTPAILSIWGVNHYMGGLSLPFKENKQILLTI